MNGSRRAGFTLVELMVAVTIISVGLIATASAMGRLIRFQRDQTVRTEMTLLAKDKLDDLRFRGATGFGGGLALGGTVDPATRTSNPGFWDEVSRAGGRRYYRLWRLTTTNAPIGTVETAVRVVLVGDLSTIPIEVTLTTYLTSGL